MTRLEGGEVLSPSTLHVCPHKRASWAALVLVDIKQHGFHPRSVCCVLYGRSGTHRAIANSTTLCRDMWPSGVGVLVQEKTLTASNVPPARLLPRAIEDLTEWLWVDLQPELSLALVYIRSDVEGGTSVSDPDVAATVGVVEEQDAQAPEHVELVIRLTGLIADMNLNVGGDWDG